jgi:hydrogen peroxide-dependent heme synthase
MTVTDHVATQPTLAPSDQSAPATAFTAFWLFEADPGRPAMSDDQREQVAQSMLDAIAKYGQSVKIHASYSTTGLSAGVDLILWVTADDCEPIQHLAAEIHRSPAGRALALRHVYLGIASMSQYDPEHSPAFLKGLGPRKYLSVYPFVKTPAWYLLSYERRRDLMIEHGTMGKEYPSVQTNTVSSFGIADQEFIVALEDDDPGVLVKMVQRLRAAEVREYTQVDTPIFLGLLTDLREAILNAL